ncbi:ThiF family adenylyltransferase [Bacteroides sp. Ga6A2]|uniref:tRNA threonylcarbamoyladenosine dehydratase n=1 Tax=unclassified Bacteroides TaxID=2646097 RepID=UPI000AB486E7
MIPIEKAVFNRSERLLGAQKMDVLSSVKVIIFGVGGVGSWCAESLVRSGIRHITMVDSDRVCITNCNRQLMATTKTIGRVKVEALKERLLDISPAAHIEAIRKVYNAETAGDFGLEEYDFIIDAIDSLSDKALLIQNACKKAHDNKRTVFISSMGAALRVDPTKVRVAEFWKVQGDALARALRNKFKRSKQFPASKFMCVYSEELPLPNLGKTTTCGTDSCICQKEASELPEKVQVNGSLSHITGIFGMTIAGLVIKNIYER